MVGRHLGGCCRTSAPSNIASTTGWRTARLPLKRWESCWTPPPTISTSHPSCNTYCPACRCLPRLPILSFYMYCNLFFYVPFVLQLWSPHCTRYESTRLSCPSSLAAILSRGTYSVCVHSFAADGGSHLIRYCLRCWNAPLLQGGLSAAACLNPKPYT